MLVPPRRPTPVQWRVPPVPWSALSAGGAQQGCIRRGGGGLKGGLKRGGGGVAGTPPPLPGSPYGPRQRWAENFSAEILLAPKALKQKFWLSASNIGRVEGGGGSNGRGGTPPPCVRPFWYIPGPGATPPPPLALGAAQRKGRTWSGAGSGHCSGARALGSCGVRGPSPDKTPGEARRISGGLGTY